MKDLLTKQQTRLGYLEDQKSLVRKGIVHLLEIKDSDIRLDNLYQCRHAVDRAIHIGGAFSATIPMVSLYYGGILEANVAQPTATDQDMFVLSKGHAIATLASIYTDLGYFDRSVLEGSRSIKSILNGHPGPVLPGVHLATGPMGQGMGVAQGLAIAGQKPPRFDVYAITGDGELQEGPIWEAVMYAGFKRLENLCVMVDHNGGQLDNVSHLHFPYHDLGSSFESFGWRVLQVDATKLHNVYRALSEFKYGGRDGKPTAIICKSTKGHGGFSDFMNNHKTNISDDILDQEVALQQQQRDAREKEFCDFFSTLATSDTHYKVTQMLRDHAEGMGFDITADNGVALQVSTVPSSVKTKKPPVREKQIAYAEEALPKLEKGEKYAAHKVIEAAMKEFAKDERIMSVDSDLASTSGLQAGVGFVDKYRALNVGVAEANMMLIGEAFGILGYNAWISTFCPFYDWKILRRIAVGHQERLEVIAEEDGWLSTGHGIDLTMVATAADLETKSNGATHMGNDDALIYNEAAHVKIINVSCPRQLLGVMRWIMEGNKGIVYMRVLRSAALVIYDADFQFEFGTSYTVKEAESPDAYIVSAGRGVQEAIKAADNLDSEIAAEVIDMPSIDEEKILDLHRSGSHIFVVDQNNGYLWTNFREVLFENELPHDKKRLVPINTTADKGRHYIHSGTYPELAAHYGVDADGIQEKIETVLKGK